MSASPDCSRVEQLLTASRGFSCLVLDPLPNLNGLGVIMKNDDVFAGCLRDLSNQLCGEWRTWENRRLSAAHIRKRPYLAAPLE